MRILGLAGRMGAGKDHVAKYLGTLYRDVHPVSLADPLKIEVEDLFGVEAFLKPYPEHVRWLLQNWGGYRRSQDPNYWVDKAKLDIQAAEAAGRLIVITDVRFENEVDLVHNLGGKVAFVWASSEVRAQRLGISRLDLRRRSEHASERLGQSACDFVVVNDSDYAEPSLGDVQLWLAGKVEPR